MAGEDDEMFMTRSLNVTPKTTEQHLIARSDKSVAYVSNHLALPLNWDLPPPTNFWNFDAFTVFTASFYLLSSQL